MPGTLGNAPSWSRIVEISHEQRKDGSIFFFFHMVRGFLIIAVEPQLGGKGANQTLCCTIWLSGLIHCKISGVGFLVSSFPGLLLWRSCLEGLCHDALSSLVSNLLIKQMRLIERLDKYPTHLCYLTVIAALGEVGSVRSIFAIIFAFAWQVVSLKLTGIALYPSFKQV